MVVIVLIYVTLIIIDRWIYNALSRGNPTFEKYYINKTNNVKLNESEYLEVIKENLDEEKHYEEYYIQSESHNKPLIYKYILSNFIMVSTHILIFFYLPMQGNYNLNFEIYCDNNKYPSLICNNFRDNPRLIIFYLLHTLYYIYSCLQIKYGLLDVKKTSVLMKNDDILSYIIFKTYKAIPFLYEIKMLIDWTFTKTALDIFQWIKLENVHDMLFIAKCYYKSYKAKLIGETIMLWEKIVFGVTFLILILGCLLGPIYLFSSLNPTNESNNIYSGYIKFSILMKENDSLLEFKLFESNMLSSIGLISDSDFEKYGYHYNTATSNFPRNQIQKIQFTETSNSLFDIPKPLFDNLINSLSTKDKIIYLVISHEFKRNVRLIFY